MAIRKKVPPSPLSPLRGSPVAPLREGLRQHGGNPYVPVAGSPIPSPQVIFGFRG
ncbi:hypothetical protein GNE08_02970 [Trichormus variabilis ARAD]|uniref:Uncharacterized protein n=1 Tax=Trichormus variabilis N2B TaxID=2681315 RepID=A0ABR6S328_ANAVA|nr:MULTISPECIES: hypothetical protein [Nostocaceae]MBC1213185.1 hypothetical protein [Trichormus variabilis ARAD]MBC1257755.1 hypothetical protein [Trichormus variabilis V5]MBC1270480.1 hypothetical protein [Trichormus variabilis FSR]MBC1300744.1 hypothetical protein [Trichormus variabilis N2B]MBC1309701.1 hypothetical protein [Trichormus variabilis PNB]